MRRKISLADLLICALGASAVRATNGFAADCNYNITKKSGADTYDVEVVLHGNFNDIGDGVPTVTVAGGTTTLHWVKTPGGGQNGHRRSLSQNAGALPDTLLES